MLCSFGKEVNKLKERLKQIRKDQKKTQEEFAVLLGTTRPAITSYERGKVVPTDTFIQLLCARFNINEHWLRTGQGDMFIETDYALLEKLVHEYNMTAAQQRIMTAFLHMDEHKREVISQSLFTFIDSLNQTSVSTASNITVLDNVSDDDLELKKRQDIIAAQFEDEKKGKMSLASTGINGHIKKA